MKRADRKASRMATQITANIIKAHEATGHTTMREHESKMKAAVTKSIQGDTRFMPSNTPAEQANSFGIRPYCVDVTTPDNEGQHHAIICNHDGKLCRHGFDYDHESNTATMHDGEPTATEKTQVYASEMANHELMVRATAETISCRAGDGNGIKLGASEPWTPGKSVSYIYAPGGVTTINAGFRRNESITCTVQVDEQTAKDLQSSFDFVSSTNKQEPYADEDHESKKATLRFPPGKVSFSYGQHRGEEGVIVTGAEPTSYGAEAVNGKVYASWSPEFATDAEYGKAKSKTIQGKKHWVFPDGVRGSDSNPARIVGLSFVTGALTNKPAFKNMPAIKARRVDLETGNVIEATWSDAAREAAAEIRKNKSADDLHFEAMRASGRASMMGGEKAHRIAELLHHHAADSYHEKNDSELLKWHRSAANEHHVAIQEKKTQPTDFGLKVMHDHTRATDATPSTTLTAAVPVVSAADPILDRIFARNKAALDEANVIALRCPEVQARIAAENTPPDVTINTIKAREQAQHDWEKSLLARNPLDANQAAITAIAQRNAN